ncbi:MAG: anti-sigma factor family protein [Chloroflexota bacterium]
MDHPTEDLLNQYLDGLLAETSRQQVELHLARCAGCRARLDEIQFVFASLESLPEIRLTRDLTPAILAKLPQRPAIRLWSPWLAAQWGSLAGVLFWLGMQAAQFIPRFDVVLPKPDFRLLASEVMLLASHSKSSIFDLPSLSFTNYQLPFTTATIVLFGVSALLLGVVGNAVLLRGRPRVRA